MSDPNNPNPNPTPEPSPTPSPNPEPAQPAEGPGSVLDNPQPAEPTEEPFDEGKLALPEGFEKGENWEKFTNIAKRLPHKAAEELMELAKQSVEAREKKVFEQWDKQQVDWQKEIRDDPELGGANFETMKQTVARVLDNPELSDPKVREALSYTGAGNHPAVVRTLFKWARALSEGASVAGDPPTRDAQGQTTADPKSAAQRMYPGGPHSGGPNLRS